MTVHNSVYMKEFNETRAEELCKYSTLIHIAVLYSHYLADHGVWPNSGLFQQEHTVVRSTENDGKLISYENSLSTVIIFDCYMQ